MGLGGDGRARWDALLQYSTGPSGIGMGGDGKGREGMFYYRTRRSGTGYGWNEMFGLVGWTGTVEAVWVRQQRLLGWDGTIWPWH